MDKHTEETIEHMKADVENLAIETSKEIKSHWAIAALLLFCLLSGFFGSWIAFRVETLQGNRQNIDNSTEIIYQEGEVIASVAEELSASVVSIRVASAANSFFFGPQVEQSAGTGIILSENGLVVTNKHVIPESATSVSIILSDGTEFSDVSIVGRDPFTDIAFLQITSVTGLKPAKLGDSSLLRVGEKVIAIGNALGQFDNSVTLGIISGKGRPLVATGSQGEDPETLLNLLQTDAAINPGNSGGPLVNIAGEVIGINTAIANDAQNIGFAIPINDVKSSIVSVQENGELIKPYLGVQYVTITPDVAEQFNLSVSKGAYIVSSSAAGAVLSGGPADKAGVANADIITHVNGVEIDKNNALVTLVSQFKAGQTVELTILRNDQEIKLDVVLEAFPNS